MPVTIKSPREIELMREAGKILAKVHEALGKELRPGMSTYEIDRLGEEMIRSFGCEPSFKNYQGYPASICVSVNEEVVHGQNPQFFLKKSITYSPSFRCIDYITHVTPCQTLSLFLLSFILVNRNLGQAF